MERKDRKVVRKSTLQVFKVIPITEPAEQAELDRRCREADKTLAAAGRKKIAGKKMRGPTLQEFELVPITDPVELAAIDRRRKAAEKAMAAATRNSGKGKSPKRK